MALAARLELRQGQSLVITPQLQQAIKLLQLSNLELEAFLQQELDRNPLLAREEPQDNEPAEALSGDSEPLDLADQAPGGAAESELDARHDDLYADASPGDRATGDAAPEPQDAGYQAADAGGAIDWSKADRGGGFDLDGEGLEGRLTREPTSSSLTRAFTPGTRSPSVTDTTPVSPSDGRTCSM